MLLSKADTFAGSLSLCVDVTAPEGSSSYHSAGLCTGGPGEPNCQGDVLLPQQCLSSAFASNCPCRAECGNAGVHHNAVDAWSKQALGADGWWVPYFCQPLEEHLFCWLAFSMGGWLPGPGGCSEVHIQGLICIALIISNKPVLSTCKYSNCVILFVSCNSFVLV